MPVRYVSTLLIVLLLSACSGKFIPPVYTGPFENVPPAPDYSLSSSWAALPDKKDTADMVPSESKLKDLQQTASADVFFIHPTSFLKHTEKSIGWNADISDAVINYETDKGSILNQASIFNGAGKIYAPRYRQAYIYSYWTSEKDKAKNAFDLAYDDVKSSFLYYLANYNHGRPFIIASHSQGSTHAIRLIKELLDGKPLLSQFIAAYIVGMDVYDSSFTVIKPCRDEKETGCFITWRTFAKDYYPPGYIKPGNFAVCTNPLTWKTDSVYAPRELNKGGILRNFNKVIPKLSDAQVLDGVLRISKPHFTGSNFFNFKNYHIVDYNLFYFNVRENAENRVRSFLKK